MKEFLSGSAYFGVLLSLFAYFIGTKIKKKLKLALFNPILIAILLVILALLALDIDYAAYNSGAKYLGWLLTPATVCLAIPLYEQLQLLKKNYRAILIGIFSGVLTSLGCVLLLCLFFGLNRPETITLLPKSVTTAIGMAMVEEMGGYPAVAAVVIIITGIIGNIFAEAFLKLLRIREPIARGVAIGTSSHAIGTSRAIEMGDVEGAMSGLSIAVAGLMTVICLSVLAQFI